MPVYLLVSSVDYQSMKKCTLNVIDFLMPIPKSRYENSIKHNWATFAAKFDHPPRKNDFLPNRKVGYQMHPNISRFQPMILCYQGSSQPFTETVGICPSGRSPITTTAIFRYVPHSTSRHVGALIETIDSRNYNIKPASW